jgi:hypothetical protein
MTKYQEFLEAINIIPEDLFNEVINSLPEIDLNKVDLDLDEFNSQDCLAQNIINSILLDWNFAYAEFVNFENKAFDLGDVQSLKDLEEIKETFSKWTITNYDELFKQIEEEENEDKENKEFDDLMQKIRSSANIEQLKEFVNSL